MNFVQKRENENDRKGVSWRVKKDKAGKEEEVGEVVSVCIWRFVCWILICICNYCISLKPPCFGIRLVSCLSPMRGMEQGGCVLYLARCYGMRELDEVRGEKRPRGRLWAMGREWTGKQTRVKGKLWAKTTT